MNRPRLRGAFSVLRHRQDAEDVAQEALAKAYRSFRQLRDRERFRGWLVRMTWRRALDRQRANRRRLAKEVAARGAFEAPRSGLAARGSGLRRAQDSGSPGRGSGAPDEAAVARERAAQLWSAIDELPEKLRLVVVLK